MTQKTVCLLSILLLVTGVIKSQNTFKAEKRIYLWDVTLSMKGYGNAPDIWDEVVNALSQNINNIIDEETEIIVLPFQTSVLEEWSVKATKKGKAEIVGKIKEYNNKNITNTNICTPMRYVMDKYLENGKRNILLLLTDGNHNTSGKYPNSNESNIDCVVSLVQEWCRIAEPKDAYAFYIMLTDNAENIRLQKALDESCRISAISGTDLNFVELLINKDYSLNLKDDFYKPITLPIICKRSMSIPSGIKIKVKSAKNDYFYINETCEVKNNAIKINVKFKDTYQNLKHNVPQEYNEFIKIHLSLDEQTKQTQPLVLLLADWINLKLINKPEKTLRIYVAKNNEK